MEFETDCTDETCALFPAEARRLESKANRARVFAYEARQAGDIQTADREKAYAESLDSEADQIWDHLYEIHADAMSGLTDY